MTGGEIRGTKFAWVAKGFSPLAVNGWLADAATCLDAGVRPATAMPPPRFGRWLRGYDVTAVDQLVSALGFDPVAPLDRPPRVHPTSQYETDCDAEWRRVSGLPGTRLRYGRGGWGSYGDLKVLGSDGQVLVTRSDSSDSPLTIAASRQVLRWRRPGRSRQDRGPAYVDAATGNPVLWMIGTHSYLSAETAVLFPGQRWLRFPVQGSSVRNGVMTAIDESGSTLLWFSKQGSAAVEIIVSPDCGFTPEILCAIALARWWLERYFDKPASGGG